MIMNKRLTAAIFAFALSTLETTGSAFASEINREQAKANFLQADANQDRLLDLNEFTQFINLNADHGIGRAAMVRRFGMHRRAFGKLDSNRDGVLSPDELAASRQRQ